VVPKLPPFFFYFAIVIEKQLKSKQLKRLQTRARNLKLHIHSTRFPGIRGRESSRTPPMRGTLYLQSFSGDCAHKVSSFVNHFAIPHIMVEGIQCLVWGREPRRGITIKRSADYKFSGLLIFSHFPYLNFSFCPSTVLNLSRFNFVDGITSNHFGDRVKTYTSPF